MVSQASCILHCEIHRVTPGPLVEVAGGCCSSHWEQSGGSPCSKHGPAPGDRAVLTYSGWIGTTLYLGQLRPSVPLVALLVGFPQLGSDCWVPAACISARHPPLPIWPITRHLWGSTIQAGRPHHPHPVLSHPPSSWSLPTPWVNQGAVGAQDPGK